ncbi:hypothetical protein [Chryseobacterium aquaticum]|uniref:DNA-binding protein n=1 Tax=Chryseobacterium aquaticum subsp. greenlandense TaxID=345663 RepID=A0A117KA75_9FLAO|nr:hypothetical protein [Chryseobacterium aquaticum]KUJ53996.1 hypothetical protein AR686_17570 [Chryseobacterium aquaticum subsp. greenlandense]
MNLNYSKPINEDLVNYFKEYTTNLDVAKSCEIHGVGFHTLRRLRTGDIPVSNEKNENAIKELMRLAIINADSKILKAKKCKKDVQKILDLV